MSAGTDLVGPGAGGGDPARSGGDVNPHPLRSLLRKDRAVLQPRYRVGIGVVFVLGALQAIRSDEAFLWLGILLAGVLALTAPVIEWRLDADRLVGSLPVERRSIVWARYLGAGLACVLAWGVWVAAGTTLGPVLSGGPPAPRIWADLPGTLTFFTLAALLLGTFLPLYLGLGLGRATVAFVPLGPGLALAAGRVAGAVAPLPASGGERLLFSTLPGAAIRQAVAGLVADVGGIAAAALVAAGLLGLTALSAGVAAAAYRRREL